MKRMNCMFWYSLLDSCCEVPETCCVETWFSFCMLLAFTFAAWPLMTHVWSQSPTHCRDQTFCLKRHEWLLCGDSAGMHPCLSLNTCWIFLLQNWCEDFVWCIHVLMFGPTSILYAYHQHSETDLALLLGVTEIDRRKSSCKSIACCSPGFTDDLSVQKAQPPTSDPVTDRNLVLESYQKKYNPVHKFIVWLKWLTLHTSLALVHMIPGSTWFCSDKQCLLSLIDWLLLRQEVENAAELFVFRWKLQYLGKVNQSGNWHMLPAL